MAAITLRGVGFEYAAAPGVGLRDVDLSVEAGELVVLCGPSGSGKSTLTRVLNGLAPQFYAGRLTGSVQVLDFDVARTPVATLARQVGSVFQDPRTQFFTGDTISELAFGPENLGWQPERIADAIESSTRSMRLDGILDRSVLALSGGEQQRLACAVASIADPPVLVLDEPSSTLDTAAVASLASALDNWRRAGKTIVIAEHRLDYLADMADRFIYFDAGRIAGCYTSDEFLALGPERWTSMGLRSPVSVTPPVGESPAAGQGIRLSCRDVRLRRGKRVVVDVPAVDLDLTRPVALIGPNGSGKSTFARWLAGLGGRGAGKVTLDGVTMKARQRLAATYFVAQNTNQQLFSDTVLGEVLSAGCDEADAVSVLQSLDLDGLAARHPLTLSGGEKQRLVIAVAMASRRHLVILDEPTSGLDARHMRQVAGAIETLRADGRSVIVITHDAELVALTCGAVIRLG